VAPGPAGTDEPAVAATLGAYTVPWRWQAAAQ
jgi:hypothetical protein